MRNSGPGLRKLRQRREKIAAAALFATATALSLFAAEAVARLSPRYALSSFVQDFKPPLKDHPAYRSDALLGYAHMPNALTSMNSRTNSLGLVNPDYPLRKAPGTVRLLVIGDSITEDGRYTAELERLLNEGASSGRFEVWNAGVGGYNVVQYARLLESAGLGYDPDLILIGFCLNDFTYEIPVFYRDANQATVYAYEPQPNKGLTYDMRPWAQRLLSPWLLRHSALYRMALTLLHSRLAESSSLLDSWRRMGDVQVRRIQELASARKIPVAAVVFPYLMREDELPRSWRMERRVMTSVLNAARLPWLDLATVFDGANPADWRLFPDTAVHPSKAGQLAAGRAIYAFVKNLGWTQTR